VLSDTLDEHDSDALHGECSGRTGSHPRLWLIDPLTGGLIIDFPS